MLKNDEVKAFTDSLYELTVNQNISLIKSLEIMAYEKKSKLQKTCEYLHKELMNGNRLSFALQTCHFLAFDAVYISFIGFSEITGNLEKTLRFLKERCERQEETQNRLIEALLYPAFVMILAILGVWYMQNRLFTGMGEGRNAGGGVIILLGVCFAVFGMIVRNLKEDKLYEAFLAIGFLVDCGVNVSLAVDAGVIILGAENKYGKYFLNAKKKLENGMDVYDAFEDFRFDKGLKNTLYYARMAGNNTQIFEKVAMRMNVEDEKKRKRIISMVEPLFIGITGMFLLFLMVTYFMPLMTDTSWMNV